MANPRPTLLLTRPLAASEQFFAQLPFAIRKQVTLRISPLMEITPTVSEIAFTDVTGIIFTSSNGVEVASRLTDRREPNVYCVGHATTRAAQRLGWTARFAGETAEQLLTNLRTQDISGSLLHLAGEHRRVEIAKRLTAAGCPTRCLPIYDQVLKPMSSAALADIRSRSEVIAPVFSPRTARQLVSQVPNDARIHLIALSSAVAEPLVVLTRSSLIVTDRPDAASMAEHLQSVLNTLCRVESSGGAQ